MTKTTAGEELPYQIKKDFEKEKREQILARRQDKKQTRERYLRERKEAPQQDQEEEEPGELWEMWNNPEDCTCDECHKQVERQPTETLDEQQHAEEKDPVITDELDEDRSWERVRSTLDNVGIVIGMHPDQAAGAIVDFAIARGIPFAITPCCVYSEYAQSIII